MNHYTYMIKANAMFYIGARSCECLPEDDKYYGSCDSFTAWQKENGIESLEKHITGTFPSRALAIEHEIELHNFYDVAKNKLFWNKAKQTAVGFDTTGIAQSEELKIRKSIKTKGIPKTEEHKEKIRQAHIGKKKSEEHCKNLSKSKKGLPSPLKGRSIGRGRKFTDEHKCRIGAANKGKVREKIECPHCKKQGMKTNMIRFHFNNCKEIA